MKIKKFFYALIWISTLGFLINCGIVGYGYQLNKIVHINNINVNIYQGSIYKLPLKVPANMSDGTIKQVAVKWSENSIETDKIGKYELIGNVVGYEGHPILILIVKSDKLTIKEIAKLKRSVVSFETIDAHGYVGHVGSGFIVSSDGKIITCFHVIKGIQTLKVILDNGKKYEVEGVLNYSEKADVAVIKLKDAKDLPALQLGDSNKLELGDEVVAIGNPLGYTNTVSNGIISGLNRESGARVGSDIQFTDSIDKGSSGGALLNMKGQVVGITYASCDTSNIGFAIPINDLNKHPYLKDGEVESLQIVNPLSEYDKYGLLLKDNYPSTIINGQAIKYDYVYIADGPNNNSIYVIIEYHCDNYNEFVKQLSSDSNKRLKENRADYEKWILDLFNKIKQQYPNKQIYGAVQGQLYFDFKPLEQEYANAVYDTEQGKWIAYTYKFLFGDCNDNNQYKTNWIDN